MSDWGASVFGDPCRECGYAWSISQPDAVAIIAGAPDRYADALEGRTGREQHLDLTWSVGDYVCHVTDNLRIWAERLAGAALGGSREVGRYDPDLLAAARVYIDVDLRGALWSLRRAADAWVEAYTLAAAHDVVLHHPDRGDQTYEDVARTNAHDTYHHEWDIHRSLER